MSSTFYWLEKCSDYTRNDPMEPLRERLKRILSAEELAKIEKKQGSIAKFEKAFLKRQLSIQTQRIKQFEEIFGAGKLKLRGGYVYKAGADYGLSGYSNAEYIKRVLGKTELSEAEKIALKMETEDLKKMAIVEYLLKYIGMDLNDYSMMFIEGERVSSFTAGALRCVARDIYKKIHGSSKQSCEQLKALSTGSRAHIYSRGRPQSDY